MSKNISDRLQHRIDQINQSVDIETRHGNAVLSLVGTQVILEDDLYQFDYPRTAVVLDNLINPENNFYVSSQVLADKESIHRIKPITKELESFTDYLEPEVGYSLIEVLFEPVEGIHRMSVVSGYRFNRVKPPKQLIRKQESGLATVVSDGSEKNDSATKIPVKKPDDENVLRQVRSVLQSSEVIMDVDAILAKMGSDDKLVRETVERVLKRLKFMKDHPRLSQKYMNLHIADIDGVTFFGWGRKFNLQQ